MLKLSCFILHGNDIFPINIDGTKTENAQPFANVNTRSLALFRIDIDISQRSNYDSMLDKISKGSDSRTTECDRGRGKHTYKKIFIDDIE